MVLGVANLSGASVRVPLFWLSNRAVALCARAVVGIDAGGGARQLSGHRPQPISPCSGPGRAISRYCGRPVRTNGARSP